MTTNILREGTFYIPFYQARISNQAHYSRIKGCSLQSWVFIVPLSWLPIENTV